MSKTPGRFGPIRRFLHNTSFRKKLLLTYIIAILIPLATLSTYSLFTMYDYNRQQVEYNYQELLSQMANTLSYKLRLYRTAIEHISNNAAIGRALQNTDTTAWERYQNYKNIIDPALNSIQASGSDSISMTIYQNNELLVNHSPTVKKLELLGEPVWMDDVINYESVWLVSGGNLFNYTRIVSQYKNAPVSILETKLNASSIFALGLDSIDSYYLSVADNENRLMWYGIGSDVSIIGAAALDTGDNSLIDFHGVPYIVLHSGVASTGWHISMFLPAALITLNTRDFAHTTAFVALLCFLITLPIVMWFAKSLIRRIDVINRKMLEVKNGNLSIGIDTPYKDEIGNMTMLFNSMVKSLDNTMNELANTRIRQKDAEMRALRAQINPHFLYNTLSLINWKAINSGASEVSAIASTFSRFYRTALNKGKSEGTLGDEITNVKCYVDIQLEMHSNSFTAEYDVPAELTGSIVPSFILQPLAENAIAHGIDTARGVSGRLKVSARREDDRIRILVANNGTPFPHDAFDAALHADEHGYGLRNVHERILFAYGGKYGLSLSEPEPGYTTCIAVCVPEKEISEGGSSSPPHSA